MKNYTMIEKQSPQSIREGVNFAASSLTQAKRKATMVQFYQGTYLELIETDTGYTVAAKEASGNWIKPVYFAE